MWGHNIFDDIINDDNDFVGKVAYSIYKQEKVAWVKHYENEHGKFPSKEDIQTFFHSPMSRKESIERFRNEAESVVNTFVTLTLSEELSSYKEAIKDDAIILQIKKPFWTSVFENLTVAILAATLTAVFSTSYWLYGEMQDSKKLEALIQNAPIPEDIKNTLRIKK